MTPRVSVVVAARDASATIAQTLQAIRAQTIDDWEVIVVDDGSVDDTAHLASSLDDGRIRVIVAEHAGVSASRNRGIRESTAPIITFVDADDIPEADWLEQLTRPFDDEHIGVVCCRVTRALPDGTTTTLGWKQHPEFGPVLFLAGSYAARRDLAAIEFDDRLAFGENSEFGHRLMLAVAEGEYGIARIEAPLVRWNANPSRQDARDAARLATVTLALEPHVGPTPPAAAALHRRIAAVNAARIGHLRTARSHARAAIALEPFRRASVSTFVGTWVNVLGDRWSRPSAGAAGPGNQPPLAPDPLISVLVPVFNGEQTIDAAIDSVLRQTYQSFELVVVDDGSTDRTSAILSGYRHDDRVTVLTNAENRGLVAALNRGLAACRGELVARLDADDLASPCRLERQVAAFSAEPELVLCATAYDRVSNSGQRLKRSVPPLTHAELAAAMLAGNRLHHSSVMFRRTAVMSVGGYAEDWFPVEDYDLWLRLLDRGHYLGVPTVESIYVQRQEGISATNKARQERMTAERAARYRADLIGREAPSRPALQILETARASLSLRRRLRRRRVQTTGLDRQALLVANHLRSDQSRIVRAALVLALAPRLAVLGRLDRVPQPRSSSSPA